MSRPRVKHSGFFVARSPLLPLDALTSLTADLESLAVADDDAVRRDFERVAARVRGLVLRPDVREAIFVASPSLDAARGAWLADPSSSRAAGFFLAALRYIARMAARPTPFGLFSGCALGAISDTTSLDIGAATLRRHTRLDMHYLVALTQALEREGEVASTLSFQPSSGVVRASDTIRYAEASVDPATRERHLSLVSVERTEHLDATLALAEGGARLAALADALRADGATPDEADAYLDELVSAQILTSSIAPPVTGGDPLAEVIRALDVASRVDARGASRSASVRDALSEARAAVEGLDRGGVGLHPDRYLEVTRRLTGLPIEAEPARLFHVDLWREDAGLSLGAPHLQLVEDAISSALAVSVAREANPELRAFRDAFVERYDQREVPLGEALDEERGIGFPAGRAVGDASPLLDGLLFPAREVGGRAIEARDRFLSRRVAELARAGAREWVLTDEDLRSLRGGLTDAALPDAFAVFGRFLLPDDGTDKPWFSVDSVSGPSGATLLGRFCHGDAVLTSAVRRHTADEEALQPGAIFAEVVHLPEGRAGNVLCRPLLRSFEIPLYGRSGAPPDRQIKLSDLAVSVRDGRLTLRSVSLDREVLPRMTSAHNPDVTALGQYRFLCAMQYADAQPIGFSWGSCEATATWLPRVRHGRVVLAPARWVVSASQLRDVASGTTAQRFRATQALRAELGLPRWVGIGTADNVLPLDLDNPCLIEAAAQMLKGPGAVTLVEAPGVTSSALTTGPRGSFAHEIVVPFTRQRAPSPPRTFTARASSPRSFAPGSEWLYARIYCGTTTADAVLVDLVKPLVAEAIALGCDRWFFIRYADPRPHLRVRFRGAPSTLSGALLPRLHAAVEPWLGDGRVGLFNLDTYQREVERYGGDEGVELAEEIFQVDSELSLGLVEQFRGDHGYRARWRLALYGMHTIAQLFTPDRAAALALVRQARRAFAEELRVDATTEALLGRRYRAERAALARLCDEGPAPELPGAVDVFGAAIPRLRDLARRHRLAALEGSRALIAQSFVHMHVNRMLRSQQREQEFALYDLLLRLYESEAARARRQA